MLLWIHTTQMVMMVLSGKMVIASRPITGYYIFRQLCCLFYNPYINPITGVIMNDETVHQLCKQAVSQVNSMKPIFL